MVKTLTKDGRKLEYGKCSECKMVTCSEMSEQCASWRMGEEWVDYSWQEQGSVVFSSRKYICTTYNVMNITRTWHFHLAFSDWLKDPFLVPLKELRGHAHFEDLTVLDIAWHPYEPFLLTSGADATIRLWHWGAACRWWWCVRVTLERSSLHHHTSPLISTLLHQWLHLRTFSVRNNCSIVTAATIPLLSLSK